ncbi:DUF3885 domain-containing protein [Caldalkalibacillus mannanilyticus]|uniref:DUF3885 domain-containing protein n=1 Tax=Caldalkalibacillus mannanilyticus TaxID=1418 RepID=UPI000469CBC8|nr:DUF3885 domain-containing protein [Caldalkalibacillus mannanilyticus]
MKEKLFTYIVAKCPNLSLDAHLRFELGEPYENGTEERIQQVVKRVCRLFEEVFNPNDYVYIYIKDWETEDIMFGNTTPDYIYELLREHILEEETLYELDEDYDESGEVVEIKKEYKVKISYAMVNSIPYKEILEGIGNYEQGREPSISQSVFFICPSKDIIFHMYDDRGCTIDSDHSDKLDFLYHKYNDWLVDYWREYFDSIFKKA